MSYQPGCERAASPSVDRFYTAWALLCALTHSSTTCFRQSAYGNVFLDAGGLIEDSVFRNNTAAYGGGLYLNSLDGVLTIDGCFFDSNRGGVCNVCDRVSDVIDTCICACDLLYWCSGSLIHARL